MKKILKEILANILAEHGEKKNLRKGYWTEDLDLESLADAIMSKGAKKDERRTFVCELTNSRNSNVYRRTPEIIAKDEEIVWYAKGMKDTFFGTRQKRVNIYIYKNNEYKLFKTI